MPSTTRINARAVIQNDNKILLCHFVRKDKTYYFLPGGGVEFAEDVVTALGRELKEELGVKLLDAKFIGGVENLFDNDGKLYHELNLVFSVTIDDMNPQSKEDHIAFSWMPIADLERENVLPKPLVSAVVKWMNDGQTFWVGLGT